MEIYDEVLVGMILEKNYGVDKSIAYDAAHSAYYWIDHGRTIQEIAEQIHGILDYE